MTILPATARAWLPRIARTCLPPLLALALGACGGDAAAPTTDEPQPVVATAAGPLVTATIGAAGGTVEAVAADGTRYRLVVPTGALPGTTALTLEPVRVTGTLALPVTLSHALRIGPSGLQFNLPVTLEVTPAAGTSLASLQPYLMNDAGTTMGLRQRVVNGRTLSFTLGHLSIPGLSPDPVPAQPSREVSVTESFEARIAALAAQIAAVDLAGGNSDTLRRQLEDELSRHFDQTLLPAVQAALAGTSEEAVRQAARQVTDFLPLPQQIGHPRDAEFAATLGPLLLRLVQHGVELAIGAATTQQTWRPLAPISSYYLPLAAHLGEDTDVNGLSLAALQQRIPLEVVISALETSATPTTGQPFQVALTAGYRIGAGQPVRTDGPLQARLDFSGATPLFAEGSATGGRTEFGPFRVDAGSSEVGVQALVGLPALAPLQFNARLARNFADKDGVYVLDARTDEASGFLSPYLGYGTIQAYFRIARSTLALPPDPASVGLASAYPRPGETQNGLFLFAPSLVDGRLGNVIPLNDARGSEEIVSTVTDGTLVAVWTSRSENGFTQRLELPLRTSSPVTGSLRHTPADPAGESGYVRFTGTLRKLP